MLLDASPMISKRLEARPLSTLSSIRSCTSIAEQFSMRKSISSRMCRRYSLSLFRPDHVLFHIGPDARMKPSNCDQINLSAKEIFQVKR